jgi:hypothetical protein
MKWITLLVVAPNFCVKGESTMKRLALMSGALMLVATFLTSGSYAAEPVQAKTALYVQTTAGTPATNVGWYRRAYRRGYRRGYWNNYYRPGYRYNNYYRGYRYSPNYYYGRGYGYYGPFYYRGPRGVVNAYPGGVNVGGLHVGW